MILKQTIKMTEPTLKHKIYVNKALDYINGLSDVHINIAEGAIRAGKTIDNCFLAAAYLEVCPDRIHLASGSSIHNAKLNIGDCNGHGLEYLFKGRCRWGKYKDNEALIIQTQTGEKIVIFAGGGKADSYKGILGNSYGMWIATEINEHYDSDDSRTSFIMVAQGRQLAAEMPFDLWDLNPCNPNHDIYTKYIDRYVEEGIANHGHFTLYDNSSLTPERIAKTEKRYIVGTVAYRRDIKGERCIAEGLIYQGFADNETEYYVKVQDLPRNLYITIGIDWGDSGSGHAFHCAGHTYDRRLVYNLVSEWHDAAGMTTETLMTLVEKFIKRVERFGEIREIYADSERQMLLNSLRERTSITIKNSLKNKISDRIDFTNILLAEKRWFIIPEYCDPLVKSMRQAIYDPKSTKEDIRLDDGSYNVDSLDGYEYSIEKYMKAIVREL